MKFFYVQCFRQEIPIFDTTNLHDYQYYTDILNNSY